MIIGIDGNEANTNSPVGINEYAYQLLLSLNKLLVDWPQKHKLIVFLQNEPLSHMPKESKFLEYKVISGRGMWILKKLVPHLLFSPIKPDVFFTPSHYIPPFVHIPRACSIMDLGYLEFSGQFKKKDYWQLKLWSAYSIFASKKVFVISDSTAKDVVRHYPSASEKVVVTPLAYDKSRFNTLILEKDVRRVKMKYSIVNDYFLFVSTLKPSKNIEGLIQSFSKVVSKNPETKLVIAGKKGWLYESIFQKAKDLNIANKVIFTDYVSEEDKPALIKGAKALVLPSFWEGFGLDPLYAMASGVPVIVSKVGSLPEVVGKAGLYVDPYDNGSITAAMNKILEMSKLEYNNLVKLGLSQAKKFSWDETAKLTLRSLEEIK